MTRKTVRIAGLGAMIIIAMLVLSPEPLIVTAKTQQPATADVKIDSFSFGPATLTMSVGTTVTWTNRDDIPHNPQLNPHFEWSCTTCDDLRGVWQSPRSCKFL